MPSAHPALATRRLLQVGAAFVIVYAAANHLTSLRGDIGHGVFEWERAIPFVEWTVLPYLSIFLLLPLSFFVCRDTAELHMHVRRLLVALALAAVCYAAFPLGFHFERPQPQGPLAPLFGMLWTLDLPYNRAPSLHIVVLLLMWPRLVAVLGAAWQRGVAHAWLAAIGVSVLTTYQHHVIDIAGGMAVAGACLALTRRDVAQPLRLVGCAGALVKDLAGRAAATLPRPAGLSIAGDSRFAG